MDELNIFNTLVFCASAAASGFIGSRTESAYRLFADAMTKKLHQANSEASMPENEHIGRAIHEAKAKASQILLYRYLEIQQQEEQPEVDVILLENEMEYYLEDQYQKSKEKFPDLERTVVYGNFEVVLTGSDAHKATISELRTNLSLILKAELKAELTTGLKLENLPTGLNDLIANGWVDREIYYDWFQIFSVYFSDYVKNPENVILHHAVTNRLLSDIKVGSDIIHLKVNDVISKFDDFVEFRIEIRNQYRELIDRLDRFGQRLTEAVDQTKEVRSVLTELSANDQEIIEMLNKVSNQLDADAKTIFIDSGNARNLASKAVLAFQSVAEANAYFFDRSLKYSADKSDDNLKLLGYAEEELKLSQYELEQATTQLEQLRKFVFETDLIFKEIDLEAGSEELKKANHLFREGEFSAVMALLNSSEREIRRAKLLAQSEWIELEKKEFAIGDLLSAKVILIDFNDPNRLNKAKTFFELSISTYPHYENHFEYAEFNRLINAFERAIVNYEKAITFTKESEYIKIARAEIMLGQVKLSVDREESFSHFEKALNLFLKIETPGPVDLEYIAVCYEAIAKFYGSRRSPKVLDYYHKALAIYQSLRSKGIRLSAFRQGSFFNNYGLVLEQIGNPDAPMVLKAAVDFFQGISSKGDAYMRQYVGALLNLGSSKMLLDVELKKSYLLKALDLTRAFFEIDKSWTQMLTSVLQNLGNFYNTHSSQELGEVYYQEAILHLRKLVNESADLFQPKLAAVLHNYGTAFIKFPDISRPLLEEALALREELTEKNIRRHLSECGMTLLSLGVLFDSIDKAAAKEYLERSFEILEAYYEENKMIFAADFEKVSIELLKYYQEDKTKLLKIIDALVTLYGDRDRMDAKQVSKLIRCIDAKVQIYIDWGNNDEAIRKSLYGVMYARIYRQELAGTSVLIDFERLLDKLGLTIETAWTNHVLPTINKQKG